MTDWSKKSKHLLPKRDTLRTLLEFRIKSGQLLDPGEESLLRQYPDLESEYRRRLREWGLASLRRSRLIGDGLPTGDRLARDIERSKCLVEESYQRLLRSLREAAKREGAQLGGREEVVREPSERFYHWWREPDTVCHAIKKEFLREIVEKKMEETKAQSFRDLCIDKMGLSDSERRTYQRWLSGRTERVEEGWFTMRVRDRRVCISVGIGRYVDVTDHLPSDFVKGIKPGRFGMERIEDPEVRGIINRFPPRVLIQEYERLMNEHQKEVLKDEWPEPRPCELRVGKDGRVTVGWRFETENQRLVEILHDRYGMLPGTWKQKVFDAYYNVYKKLRGRKLTDGEVKMVEQTRKRYSCRIPEWWMVKKLRELFPAYEELSNIEENSPRIIGCAV